MRVDLFIILWIRAFFYSQCHAINSAVEKGKKIIWKDTKNVSVILKNLLAYMEILSLYSLTRKYVAFFALNKTRSL